MKWSPIYYWTRKGPILLSCEPQRSCKTVLVHDQINYYFYWTQNSRKLQGRGGQNFGCCKMVSDVYLDDLKSNRYHCAYTMLWGLWNQKLSKKPTLINAEPWKIRVILGAHTWRPGVLKSEDWGCFGEWFVVKYAV